MLWFAVLCEGLGLRVYGLVSLLCFAVLCEGLGFRVQDICAMGRCCMITASLASFMSMFAFLLQKKTLTMVYLSPSALSLPSFISLSHPPSSLSVDDHTHTERMQRLAFIWQSVKRKRSQLRKPAAKTVVQHAPNLKISIVLHREISAEQKRVLARAGASEGVVVWGLGSKMHWSCGFSVQGLGFRV